MSLLDSAPLTEMLLVSKGGAAPSRYGSAHPIDVDPVLPSRRVDVRTRVSLRLDDRRHRRLRLAAAHLRQSAQAVLLAALDHYLDHVVPAAIEGGCRCLEAGAAPPASRFKPGMVRSP